MKPIAVFGRYLYLGADESIGLRGAPEFCLQGAPFVGSQVKFGIQPATVERYAVINHGAVVGGYGRIPEMEGISPDKIPGGIISPRYRIGIASCYVMDRGISYRCKLAFYKFENTQVDQPLQGDIVGAKPV